MGLQLDCPLCCSETFSCHNSLKYHLLSVIGNLLCPACQKRFDNVIELAMHLGRQCMEELPSLQTKTNLSDMNKEKGENIQTQTDIEFVTCSKYHGKASPLQNSSELSSLRENSSEMNINCLEESAEEDQYYCSTCSTHFTCVDKHIQTFHSGEEILLADAKEDPKIADIFVQNNESEYEEDLINPNVSLKSARLLDTIQEQDCLDKDGRLYIRKVVKIEKFWDENEVHSNTADITNLPFAINDRGLLQKLIPSNETNKIVEVYECSKCEMKFLSVNQYYKHKCCGAYKTCDVCSARFVNLKFLKAHMKKHNRKKSEKYIKDSSPPFICEICNTEFSTSKSLRLHRRMHDPIKSKDIEPPATYGKEGEPLNDIDAPREMFLCQICNKSYDKEYEEAHNQFHNKEADFTCEICNRKFHTQENLEMHMNAHTDVKKYLCPNCKKAFLTEEKLEAHKPNECQKRQYECQYCGRRFARPHEKVKHERIHTGEKPHVCAICGKSFRVSYCLTLHMRTHSGTRPYHCDICGKRFKAHSVYSHHLLTHSNDRKFKCTFCPKMFKTGVQLAGHKNSHIKPFNCTECNRPFASLYAVRAHMETHQRQNNLKYNCWLCGASYARAFALRDHFKEQHMGEVDHDMDLEGLMLDPDNCKIASEDIKTQDVLIGIEDVQSSELSNMQVEIVDT